MIKRQYVWFRRGIKFRKNNLKYFFCNLFNIEAKAVAQRCSVKKVFLKISQNSQENTCARDSVLINFIKKETLVQVFSCEFCEIFKTPFFLQNIFGGCFCNSTSSKKATTFYVTSKKQADTEG